jgi:PEP-CTERM motif
MQKQKAGVRTMRRVNLLIGSAVALAVVGEANLALATTIGFSDNFIFLNDYSANDVGITPGVVLEFGGQIAGGSAGYAAAGIFTATGSSTPTLTQTLFPCAPTSTSPGFCARTTPFTTNKLNGSWSFEVQNPGGTVTATFALPSVAPIPTTPTPFPSSVTLTNSANGINPTVSWTLPNGDTPNALAVLVFDRSQTLVNGTANVIYQATVSPNTTSFTIPTTANLIVGHKYTIGFQIIDSRDGQFPSDAADYLNRSFAFFDFTPQTSSTEPSNIALPIVDGTTGVYTFNVGNVSPDSVTYIDPQVATGYIYQTGTDDPNFASVILPDVGGGIFDLSYLSTNVTLDAGMQYFFPAGGVSEFEVTGIDPSADLDPADTSAFVTGLTFVSPGSFTGTMTPITEDVTAAPEPGSLSLLGSGLVSAAMLFRRRRKARIAQQPMI